MKNKLYLILIIVLFNSPSSAQNLVANNGFETYSALPSGAGEWWKVSGWNNVNNQPVFAWPYASPDYLSTNGTGQAHLPGSIFGTVNPYAGNAVMGFIAYYSLGAADFREYISRPLATPLLVGQKYTISFMMTNGSSNQYCGSGCNHIGIYFSASPLTQLNHEPINVTPQCEITTVWWNTTWQLVSFTYTATAPFQYFTLGNFYNDASTTHVVYNSASPSSYGAYYFIDEVVVQLNTPLPVELINFSVENKNNVNQLHWTTASETNNQYFILERSIDGISFEKIGKINGIGNSSQLQLYSFEDHFPPNGINYYRLKQIDYNGEFSFSKIIDVNNKVTSKSIPIVYPIPATNEIFISACDFHIGDRILIYNALGKIIYEKIITEPATNFRLSTQNFDSGLYLINILSVDAVVSLKMIIL